MFGYEFLRFLKEGRTGCNIHGLELWTVRRPTLTRMSIWWLLGERNGNTFRLVLSMDTWHIRWGQNILLSSYLRSNSIHKILCCISLYSCMTLLFKKLRCLPPTTLFLILSPCLQHLENVIRQRIPSIISLINKTIDELNAELDRIGRPIAVDSGVKILTLISFLLLNELA